MKLTVEMIEWAVTTLRHTLEQAMADGRDVAINRSQGLIGWVGTPNPDGTRYLCRKSDGSVSFSVVVEGDVFESEPVRFQNIVSTKEN